MRVKDIDWRARLHNKATVVALCSAVLTFVYTILGLFGVVPSVTQTMAGDVVMAVLNILTALGVLVDPTTPGVSDAKK